MIFTDSHAHLSSVAEELGLDALRELLDDYEAAAEAACREGRAAPILLDPGTEPDDLGGRIRLFASLRQKPPSQAGAREAFLRLAPRKAFLRLAGGVWPSAKNLADPERSLATLEAAIAAAGSAGIRVSAIGEGGLDYHHMEGSREAQLRLFEGQLRLASKLGLPMIVHSRDAAADTISLIASLRASLRASEKGAIPVLIHCFGYGPAEALSFLSLGCYLSFAGNLTYKKSDALREACALVPEERLLLETDAPYMNPMPRRGAPSSPRDVERTYACAAGIRGVSVEALSETVSHNARALFG
jgi:Mg-dependent DNase